MAKKDEPSYFLPKINRRFSIRFIDGYLLYVWFSDLIVVNENLDFYVHDGENHVIFLFFLNRR